VFSVCLLDPSVGNKDALSKANAKDLTFKAKTKDMISSPILDYERSTRRWSRFLDSQQVTLIINPYTWCSLWCQIQSPSKVVCLFSTESHVVVTRCHKYAYCTWDTSSKRAYCLPNVHDVGASNPFPCLKMRSTGAKDAGTYSISIHSHEATDS